MFGQGTIILSPGVQEPAVESFFKTTFVDGQCIREPLQFAVKFENGAAEVGDELGRHLIARKMASRSPPRSIPQPPHEIAAVLTDTRPRYAIPIAVGRPLTPAGGIPPPAPPSIAARVHRHLVNAAASCTRWF